jgi:hypothetical protein
MLSYTESVARAFLSWAETKSDSEGSESPDEEDDFTLQELLSTGGVAKPDVCISF